MGLFDLPSKWVYVEYSDGERVNVANTDTLSQGEADSFKGDWEKASSANGRVIKKVTLETTSGSVVKSFIY